MPKMSAATAAAMRLLCAIAAGALLGATAAKADWDRPWKDESRALVIDAYEFNPIEWKDLAADKRIAAFINKASDGMPPEISCRGLAETEMNLCKNRWWKYSVTQELYMTRRAMAKTLGLKWGAYHLGRPGNPREQADHFVDFAKPSDDDLIALDIEDNDPSKWMSLADAEIFANQIKIRLGRYPVLYTNGSTAQYIAQHKADYPLLSRLPLWYARYRDDITGLFPQDTWPTYALWQFSSMHNCTSRSCPYRVAGAKNDIDVNVSPLTVADLRSAWPFNELVGSDPAPAGSDTLVADAVKKAVETAGEDVAALLPNAAATGEKPVAGTLAAAYGPSEHHAPVDPLQLLTEAAREEHRKSDVSPVLSSLTESPRVDPVVPGDRTAAIPAGEMGKAVIDAIGQLKSEMGVVRDILKPEKRAEVPAAARPTLSDKVKSRLVDMMRKVENNLRGSSETGDVNEGERAEIQDNGRGGWSVMADLKAGDRRIAKAFFATH